MHFPADISSAAEGLLADSINVVEENTETFKSRGAQFCKMSVYQMLEWCFCEAWKGWFNTKTETKTGNQYHFMSYHTVEYLQFSIGMCVVKHFPWIQIYIAH